MFARRQRKIYSGERYEYWTLCESRRTAAGPRQRVVATMGKLTGEEPLEAAGWEQLNSLGDGKPVARRMQVGEQSAAAVPRLRWEPVDVYGARVERARDFGEAFLVTFHIPAVLPFQARSKYSVASGKPKVIVRNDEF